MKNLISCIILFLLLPGCGSRSGSSPGTRNATDLANLNADSLAFSRVFSPAMQGAIDVFNKYFEKDSKHDMFIEIRFYEYGQGCFFNIYESFHYYDFTVLGYVESSDRLYVVSKPERLNKDGEWTIMNVSELNCLDNFVNISELTPFVDSIPGYPRAKGDTFDPVGITFEIISPDSLNLIQIGFI